MDRRPCAERRRQRSHRTGDRGVDGLFRCRPAREPVGVAGRRVKIEYRNLDGTVTDPRFGGARDRCRILAGPLGIPNGRIPIARIVTRHAGVWCVGIGDVRIRDVGIRDVRIRDVGIRDVRIRDVGIGDLGIGVVGVWLSAGAIVGCEVSGQDRKCPAANRERRYSKGVWSVAVRGRSGRVALHLHADSVELGVQLGVGLGMIGMIRAPKNWSAENLSEGSVP